MAVTTADVAANRPTLANIGDLYYATDTGVSYRYNGTTWQGFANTSTAVVPFQQGTTASKPAASASNAGAKYYATDSVLTYVSNGSSWQAYYLDCPVTPPGLVSGYTTITTTGTITQQGDSIAVNMTGGGTTNTVTPGFYSSQTITPTSSIVTASFGPLVVGTDYAIIGVAIYSSSSQALVFGPGGHGSVGVWNPNVGNYYSGTGGYSQSPFTRYRWRYVSTTSVVPEMSIDGGLTWFTPAGVTASFNPSGFTQQKMGIFCGSNSGALVNAVVTHFTVS